MMRKYRLARYAREGLQLQTWVGHERDVPHDWVIVDTAPLVNHCTVPRKPWDVPEVRIPSPPVDAARRSYGKIGHSSSGFYQPEFLNHKEAN